MVNWMCPDTARSGEIASATKVDDICCIMSGVNLETISNAKSADELWGAESLKNLNHQIL